MGYKVGQIGGKGKITAGVGGQQPAVCVYRRLLVCCVKMQDTALPPGFSGQFSGGKGNAFFIPEKFFGLQLPLYAGKQAFRGKGTRIVPWAGMGVPGRIWEVFSACAADVKAYCHLPFSIR